MGEKRFFLFDADHTLLDFDADMEQAFRKMYAACGLDGETPYSPALLAAYERCNNRWWRKFERQECGKDELYLGRFVDFLGETGLRADPARLNEAYFHFLAQGGAVYPGARELLETLAPAGEIHIITNGHRDSQMGRMERSGLRDLIQGIFISEDAGFGKPDRRYFDYVFSRIPGFEKARATVVGDSLSSDIQGAVNAGLNSIWYRPPGRPNGDPPTPLPPGCRIAESYGEIAALLLT